MTPCEQKAPLPPQSYTAEQLDMMEKSWDKASFAMALDTRVRGIERQTKLTYVELGLICLRVEQKELYLFMYDGKFKSFGAWITDAAPYSRATAYSALGEVKKAIEDDMPLEIANRLPRCNLKTVNRLSSKLKRDPEILKAAETMEEQEFKRKIEKEFPDQHVEVDGPMRFKPTKSQREVIDAAIDAVMLLDAAVHTREDALEALASDYLNSHQNELEEAMGDVVEAAKAASRG